MGLSIMLRKVFVIGRPGSGKTTAASMIGTYARNADLEVQRFKDYEILYEMFQEDSKRIYQDSKQRKFRPAEYNGFDVLDYTMFDEALVRLQDAIKTSENDDKVITIEFARANYRKALSLFSSAFLKDSYLLFVDCKLGKCIHRIYERMTTPPQPDFHFVSEYIMQTYYSEENWGYIKNQCRHDFPSFRDVVAINNTDLSFDKFEQKINLFAKAVISECSLEHLTNEEMTFIDEPRSDQVSEIDRPFVVQKETKELAYT